MPSKGQHMSQGCRSVYQPILSISTIYTVRFILLLFILPGCCLTSFAGTEKSLPRDPMEYFFHQSFNDLKEELVIAIEENKSGVFVMFADKDCPWCAKMNANVLNQVAVQDYYRNHFRILTIDINGDAMITDFDGNEISEKDFAFKRHRVRATPVFMFFDTNGKKVMRFTGIVRDVKEFLWLGEYVVTGSYQKLNFTKYKRERQKQEQNVPVTEVSSK